MQVRKIMCKWYKMSSPIDIMVKISGTAFEMGVEGGYENSMQKVVLSTYYIDRKLVTNKQYVQFMNIKGFGAEYSDNGMMRIDLSNPACKIINNDGYFEVEEGYEDYPVVAVSFYGANDYAKFEGARLPTEAEWEYAYSNCNPISNINTDNANDGEPNSFGLYGMNNDLRQWIGEWYFEMAYKSYDGDYSLDPVMPNEAEYMVVRGCPNTSVNKQKEKIFRDFELPRDCFGNIGFRCVWSAKRIDFTKN